MKISRKIVFTFAPLAVVSLAVLGGLSYGTAKHALTEQAISNLVSLADLKQRRIESIIDQNRERLALVASRTQLRISLERYLQTHDGSHQQKMVRILHDAKATTTDFRKLFIQSPDGQIVAATDDTLLGQGHPWRREFAQAESGPRVDMMFRNAKDQLGVYLAAPLFLGEQRLGTLVIEADASNIIESMTSYRGLGETGESLLVRADDHGNALFLTPARFRADAALVHRISSDATDSPYVRVLHEDAGLMTKARGYDGYQVLAAYRAISGLGWGLVVQKRASEAFAPIDSMRTWIVSLTALFALIVALVSLYLARSITRPIMQLTDVAWRISEGAFRERAQVNTRDEVNLLATAFNRMTSLLLEDIAERTKAEEKFQALLRSAPDGILITLQDGTIEIVNRRAESMLAIENNSLHGANIEQVISQRHRDAYREFRGRFEHDKLDVNAAASLELCAVTARGDEVPVEVTVAPIQTLDGILLVHALRDITDRKRAEAKLVQQANFDNLTGLPSRVLAWDRLAQALARAHRDAKVGAVMFLDLDRFKNINDTLGHSVGDQLLTEVSRRIGECVRESDTVARLGGDEFLIILTDLESLESADVVAEDVLSAMAAPFRIGGREMYVSASIGITGFPVDSDQAEVLLRNADAAMYRAKEEGRNTYRFFTSEMNTQLRARLEMEEHLRHAIERGELSLHFQPQLDLVGSSLVCAEALLRWQNPVLGAVPPDRFIPLAEDTGLIQSIGAWVLEQACHEAMAWKQQLGHALRVSVNVSALQFRHGDLSESVRKALQGSGLAPEHLELELTERVLVDDTANARRTLAELKQIGVRLALDDFGTGYSSLSYLKWFPCDVLKIDRAFIGGIIADESDAALCRAIIAMGGSLGMTVVAEGVETGEQLAFLAAHGVDCVQGYFISRPLDAARFRDLLAKPAEDLIGGAQTDAGSAPAG